MEEGSCGCECLSNFLSLVSEMAAAAVTGSWEQLGQEVGVLRGEVGASTRDAPKLAFPVLLSEPPFHKWVSVQLSCVWLFVIPWTAAHQASLSITNSQSLLKSMSIESVIPSHHLSSPSLPAFSPSQHQGLFQWISSLHQVAKVLEFQLQHQSFRWIFRTDFL